MLIFKESGDPYNKVLGWYGLFLARVECTPHVDQLEFASLPMGVDDLLVPFEFILSFIPQDDSILADLFEFSQLCAAPPDLNLEGFKRCRVG